MTPDETLPTPEDLAYVREAREADLRWGDLRPFYAVLNEERRLRQTWESCAETMQQTVFRFAEENRKLRLALFGAQQAFLAADLRLAPLDTLPR